MIAIIIPTLGPYNTAQLTAIYLTHMYNLGCYKPRDQLSYPSLPMFFNVHFFVCEKNWEVWSIGRSLRRTCESPPTCPRNAVVIGWATWLTAWVTGQRYTSVSQTASDYITRLTMPFLFALRTLKNMGRLEYEARDQLPVSFVVHEYTLKRPLLAHEVLAFLSQD